MRSSVLRTSLLIAAFALAGARVASAQSYTVQVGSAPFTSIVSMGTPISVVAGDDEYGSFTAPFSFPFFGQTISAGTTLYVTTNGLLTIGTPDTSYSNTTIPGPATPMLAPFWDDQTFQYGAQAYYYSNGTTLIVEWVNNNSLDFTTESVSYQVGIDGTTGGIAFFYGPRVGGSSWTGSVGLQSSGGANGASLPCTPSCTLVDVPQDGGVLFTPTNNPPPQVDLIAYALSSLPSSIQVGTQGFVDYEIVNDGTGTAGASTVALLMSPSSPVTASAPAVASDSVPSLSVGGAHGGRITFIAPTPGIYYFGLMADQGQVVSEVDESNNITQLGSIEVLPGGGDEIIITTTSLGNGTIGAFYEAVLSQVGAMNPSWRLASGALPAGLSLDAGGFIFGTPTQATTSSFVVECSGDGLPPATQPLTLTIDGSTTGIRLVSSTLPVATVGAAYTAQLEATGGLAPYAFQVLSGAPSWLTVTGNGAVSGTPDAAGTSMMTVSIVDGEGDNAVVPLTIDVVVAGPLALTTNLASAVVGRPYSASLVSGGRPPYTVSVDSAPPGFAVDASGVLSGTGTMVGSFTMNVNVTDADATSASGAVTLTVDELRSLELVTTELTARVNASNDLLLIARGGVAPYTWSVQGALLPGLTFDSARGAIVGMPTEVGTATVSVTVLDADFAQASGPVIVRARFVTAAIDTGSRSGGCGCETGRPAEPGAAWAVWFLLVTGLVVRRARRAC